MGAGSTPTTPPTSILITGTYSSGKKRLVAAYAGKPDVVVDDRVNWVSQLKGTKGNVTIMGMPDQYGRFPAYRETNKAIADANAYIIMLKPQDKEDHIKHYHNAIKEHSKGGPVILLVSYITETPAKYDQITKFAKSINAKVETINPVKLSENNDAEMKKLEIVIQGIVDTCNTTPTGDESAPTKDAAISKSPSIVMRFFSSLFTKSSVIAAA